MQAIARKLSDLPRSFRRIRLELAREEGHPEGSARNGYELVAPLKHDGRIDAALWLEYRDICGVVRFRTDEEQLIGHLVHRPGGTWAFHYEGGPHDDEAGYHFQDERFLVGEYVSVREGDRQHSYKIISVEHL
jgi:hypothetical protein